MHYYRYRAPSGIAIKELLYSEMYFCSAEECNDPFDSKTFYQFKGDPKRWMALLKFAWRQFNKYYPSSMESVVSDEIVKDCPFSYEGALSYNYANAIRKALGNKESELVSALELAIKDILRIYRPPPSYFVSFSKKSDDPLMWSHYADKHQGWCLIFKAIDRKLWQCPIRKKRGIKRKNLGGLAKSTNFGLLEAFPFCDITYSSVVEHIDAFTLFPVAVYGHQPLEEERLKIIGAPMAQYLQKHNSWYYEDEVRLVISPPANFLAGDYVQYSQQERLLHFDPDQLVGIVFGARMPNEYKTHLMEVLSERSERLLMDTGKKRTIFPFVIFEAQLSHENRDIRIVPKQLVTIGRKYESTDKEFEERFREWTEGRALIIEGNRSHKDKIT